MITDANPLKAGVLAYHLTATVQPARKARFHGQLKPDDILQRWLFTWWFSLLDSSSYTCSEVTILKTN